MRLSLVLAFATLALMAPPLVGRAAAAEPYCVPKSVNSSTSTYVLGWGSATCYGVQGKVGVTTLLVHHGSSQANRYRSCYLPGWGTCGPWSLSISATHPEDWCVKTYVTYRVNNSLRVKYSACT